ncbi:SecY interacting protein Syd [Solibacillus sp. R5-41]|uniref:SecY-interacting protein Syd n=1 Tax=Solibacillus sp. R5-41 TaxID=2048654 RepID=UPI000C1269DD|nr:SecY-interacting protein Syd [Solibacillus sp. R5-41]ATP42446.1 SecY interacting protein Syd [Solibacillus sp. R5-41]
MRQYFLLRKKYADGGLDFLFKTPFNEDVDSFIYIGEVDEDDYIEWSPIEKTKYHEFTLLESSIKTKFHSSIIEYFNSYWFADLDGFFDDYYISLDSILPKVELESFRKTLQGYKNNHNNELENIPLGMEGNGLIVVVDNTDGTVKLEDYEKGTYVRLSKSLEDLITNLHLKRRN